MAARRIDIATARPTTTELPAPPALDPAVREAAALLARTVSAREAADAAVAAAQTALDEHADDAADALLDALERGDAADDAGEAELVDALAAARRRLLTVQGALALARGRHDSALTAARREFSLAIRPLIENAIADAADKAVAAAVANDRLRQMAQFAADEGAELPGRPHELALPLPTADRLGGLVAARTAMFAGPPAPAAGVIALKMLCDAMPYAAGEGLGLPEAEAIQWIKAGLAAPVNPDDLRRLGLTKLSKFTEPTLVRLTSNYTPRTGVVCPAGTVTTFPPDVAARIVNLGLGVPA